MLSQRHQAMHVLFRLYDRAMHGSRRDAQVCSFASCCCGAAAWLVHVLPRRNHFSF